MSSEEESELDSDLEEEEDSEDQSSDYDFLAFLVVREQDSGYCDVIPSTWVLAAYDYDNGDQTTVDYLFPSEDQIGDEIKFRKNKPRDNAWPQFFGDMLFESDSQEAAFQFIKDERKRNRQLDKIIEFQQRIESGSEEKKEAPKPSGTKRQQPANENNPKKSKTSTEPAPAASTSSTVASKSPVATAPKEEAASKARR